MQMISTEVLPKKLLRVFTSVFFLLITTSLALQIATMGSSSDFPALLISDIRKLRRKLFRSGAGTMCRWLTWCASFARFALMS